ncbi:MAG: Ribosomal RNA small subunit methyltransferase D [Eubacteriales bacterium SKADARSKE-1]|nr:Ribosomal RNA small subunit methyltransferase D [Eubacteriales bacterium SKADARSKE-1]
MRVITGTAKGKRLETLNGDAVRPTTERVKEAIFSAIQFEIEGRSFLDLFAGSGQMGIEALSRGAASSLFIDSRKESLEVIKRNLKATNLLEKAVVVNTDSLTFLNKNIEKFDIAFLDPPYRTGILEKALIQLESSMNSSGTIICENPIDEKLPSNIGKFILKKAYKHGKIMISIYCKKGSD